MVAKGKNQRVLVKGIGNRAYPADVQRNKRKKNAAPVGHRREKAGPKGRKHLQYEDENELDQRSEFDDGEVFYRAKFHENLEAVYESFGEPTVIKLREIRPNTSKRTGIVVMVEASTVSFTDCLIRRNLYDRVFREAPLPNAPGVDFVGTVVHVGDLANKHDGFEIGDRVACIYQFLGGNARFVSLPAQHCVRIPQSIDACEGACLLRPYLAALQMLFRVGGAEKKLQRGDHVLVTGANGAVGRAVVELAKLNGAIVYASCRRQHRDFILDGVGADYWLDEDPRIWDPLNVDIVIDLVCYTGDFKDVQNALGNIGLKMICAGTAKLQSSEIKYQQEQYDLYENKPAGILSGCGIHIGSPNNIYKAGTASVLPELCGAVCKAGVDRVNLWSNLVMEYDIFESTEERPDLMEDDLQLLFSLLESGDLRPIIQEIISLEEIPQAHAIIEQGSLQGSIVCQPWEAVTSL